MPRPRTGYRCSDCGAESPAFAGRCPRCQAWNTLEPYAVTGTARNRAAASAASTARAVMLSDVDDEPGVRLTTGIVELDRVLGGGLVPGGVILVGGEPGIGKSTLMLQAAARLARGRAVVGYVCGEESPRQVRLRAARLGIEDAPIRLYPETTLDLALAAAAADGVTVLVIDSIQAVTVEDLEARAGGPAQLGEACSRIVGWAKEHDIATLVTGHVTKTGELAGPRLLEHLVDAVIYFEGADGGAFRIIRAVKNRFGATDEVGVFEMTGEGLQSVDNPSAAFLAAAESGASGCAVTAAIEGTRPLVVEVQALAVPSFLATPRRIASGIEAARLHVLLAVLTRRGGVSVGNIDIVATVSGGLRLSDTASDLAVFCALASAVRDRPLAPGVAFLGEIALSGAVRPVQHGPRRVAELARLGFTRIVGPADLAGEGAAILPVRTVREALHHALSD